MSLWVCQYCHSLQGFSKDMKCFACEGPLEFATVGEPVSGLRGGLETMTKPVPTQRVEDSSFSSSTRPPLEPLIAALDLRAAQELENLTLELRPWELIRDLRYALRAAVLPPQERGWQVLLEFAQSGARLQHNYFTEGIETLSSDGHHGAFTSCQHPDCVLVSAVLPPPPPRQEIVGPPIYDKERKVVFCPGCQATLYEVTTAKPRPFYFEADEADADSSLRPPQERDK